MDTARVYYVCYMCNEIGDAAGEVKHTKEECKGKLGATVKKVCEKSGTAPHSSAK